MDEQLKAMFPWLGAQNIQYAPDKNASVNFKEIGDVTLGYGFSVNNQPFVFVPESYLQKGVQVKDRQVFSGNVLRPEFDAELAKTQSYTINELASLSGQDEFIKDYKKSNFSGNRGFLVPESLVKQYLTPAQQYLVNETTPEGFVFGPIAGASVNEAGQKFYSVEASGRPNASAWITADELSPKGMYVTPGKKWYETTLGKVGIALIAGGTAGLALGGAGAAGGAAGSAAGGAAAGGTAAGTGITAGAAGTTGLTAGTTATGIGAGAAGTGLVAPAGFTFAPGVGAGVAGAGVAAGTAAAPSGSPTTGLLDTAQFGQTGQTGLTPGAAGQGLQVPTTPGLSSMGGGTGLTVPVTGGTVTQLGFVPTGATPVLGDPASFINNPDVLGNTVFSTDYLAAPGAAAGLSASDALRLMNQARGLLGAGQNPIVPQQQGLPQQAGGAQGVDYSGLLSLLQLQAGLPGVAPLTAPAQLRQIYQPTLLPNVLSLLG